MAEHIKIAGIEPRIQYVGDGITRTFTYPFPAFHAEDVSVYLSNTKQQTGFTVTGIGESYGGAIVFDSPPTSSLLVTIQRETRVERITDFQSGGEFRANALNDELDYQTAVLQEHARDVDRALRLAPNDPTADLVLPPVAERANKLLGFDASGDAIATEAAGGGPGGVTDHGQLTGLSDDDHPQYQTAARADIWFAGKLAGSGSAPTAARSDHTNTAGSVTVATGNPVVNPITSTNAQAALEELALEMTTHRHDALYAQRNWVPIPKWDATVNPGPNDDIANSYTVGSKWVNLTTDEEFTCVDHTTGAAIWKSTTAQATGGGGGGMLASVYDPAGVGGQIVDLDTLQTLSNKRIIPTGAVTARTLEARAADVRSVKDFGAVGDGVANDTAAIQAAINAVKVAGGELLFPPGRYRHTGLLLDGTGSTGGGVTLRGIGLRSNQGWTSGAWGAVLLLEGATGTHIEFRNTNRCAIEDLAFMPYNGVVPSGGKGVYVNGGQRFDMRRAMFERTYDTLTFENIKEVEVDTVYCNYVYGAYGIKVSGLVGSPAIVYNWKDVIVYGAADQGTGGGAPSVADAVVIGPYCWTHKWTNLLINDCQRGIVIGEGCDVNSKPLFQTFIAPDIEHCRTAGIQLHWGTDLKFIGGYCSVNEVGLRAMSSFTGANGGVQLIGGQYSYNGTHGILLDGCPNTIISACKISNNSHPTINYAGTRGPANTYDGIRVTAAEVMLNVSGCRIGGLSQGERSTGNQRYGVSFAATVAAGHVVIGQNDLANNTTGGMFKDAAAVFTQASVSDNIGIPTTAAANPTVNDDATKGYQINSLWTNTTTDAVFACVDNTAGAAVWADLTAAGSGGVTVQDEGTPLATTASTLNFVGAGVVASGAGATKTITIAGGGGGITLEDEGSTVTGGPHSTLNFAGAGVTVTNAGGGEATVTITSGGGSGDVVGPGSATDNAFARFDLATGKLVQSSVVVADDSGNISGVGTLTASGIITAPVFQGPVAGNVFLKIGNTTADAFVQKGSTPENYRIVTSWVAAADPTVNDDTSLGYRINNLWLNNTTGRFFVCRTETDGAAVWVPLTPTEELFSSGTPTLTSAKGSVTLSGTATAATLPAIPAWGALVAITNTTAGSVTINSAGGNTITTIAGVTGGTSISIAAGASASLTAIGGGSVWQER